MNGPQARFEISTLATPEAISDLTERVMSLLQGQGVEPRATHHTALVLNEVLTNLGTHGGCPDCPARISLLVEPDRVTGEIVDSGPPFDPRLAPEPSLGASVEDRTIGGLGLYLARKLSGGFEYARLNGKNCTSFVINRNDASAHISGSER